MRWIWLFSFGADDSQRQFKRIRILCGTLLFSFGMHHGYSQGPFVNLDFEHPILPLIQGVVQAANAIPGWSVYIDGSQVDWVFYNTVSGGAPAVSFHDAASHLQPIEGNYSVLLQPSFGGPPTTVAVGQTGQIPATMKSLVFYGYQGMLVTFGGQPIPLSTLGTTPDYHVLGGDISPFAGQSGEIRIQGGGLLDNIQFSTQPIPEPSTWAFMALGGALIGVHQLRRQRRRGTS